MNNFPSDIIENFPGVARFYFAPAADVYKWSYFIENNSVDQVVFQKNAHGWYIGYSILSSLLISEKPEKTKHGNVYNNEVKGSLPQDRPELLTLLNEMKENNSFIVVCVDNNGYNKLIGDPKYPCRFAFELNKNKDNNDYEFRFYNKTPRPAYFLSNIQELYFSSSSGFDSIT